MDPRSTFEKRESVRILDVREPKEWKAGHIEGAQHIPMGEIPQRFDEIDDSKPLVAVCRSGARSEQVTRFLQHKGYEVQNLDGGIEAWARAGLPITGPGGRAGKVV